ncbi:MAG: ThuA domain-containing protein [Candidatus Sumerlaeota bacterium]|nr:ThuA domain-containing protein [Candidatus Sumerlaeota bacterium]
MALKALIVQGGFKPHEPKETSDILAAALRQRGVEVEVSDTLETFKDKAKLEQMDLLVPHWTFGELPKEETKVLCGAVQSGISLAGIHGGAGDAFRGNIQFQHMVGGQFLAHPGGQITYTINIRDHEHPITQGLKDFSVTSEQYYMLIDPAIHALATTNAGEVVMPVAWTKTWGRGNVYYCSLGHSAAHLAQTEALELVIRGFMWAARKTAEARGEQRQ